MEGRVGEERLDKIYVRVDSVLRLGGRGRKGGGRKLLVRTFLQLCARVGEECTCDVCVSVEWILSTMKCILAAVVHNLHFWYSELIQLAPQGIVQGHVTIMCPWESMTSPLQPRPYTAR